MTGKEQPVPTGLRKILLACGIVSSLLYVAMNAFVAMQYEGYSSITQTVSELSAVGAPTRALWVVLGVIYTLLMTAFGWGVRTVATQNRPLRIAGGLMVAYGITGLGWPLFPMHLREVLATGGGNWSDTMHIVFTMFTVLLMLLAMGYGAVALGKRFRLYSIATILTLLTFGALTGTEAPRDRRERADAVDRDLRAHQHRGVPALGGGAGRDAFAEGAVGRATGVTGCIRHDSRTWAIPYFSKSRFAGPVRGSAGPLPVVATVESTISKFRSSNQTWPVPESNAP